MTVRNIRKSLAVMEDLTQGVGPITQHNRQGQQIDVPYSVNSAAEMQALDVDRWTRARVYADTTTYTEYVYDPADQSGIAPDEGTGSWIIPTVGIPVPPSAGTYATVAVMKGAPLVAGELVQTVDYYSTQRGGGASYLIKTAAQADADGDVIDGYGNHLLASGDVAILQGSRLSVEHFGSIGDGIAFNADSFEAAANHIGRFVRGGDLDIPNGVFVIERTVFVPVGVTLVGQSPLANSGTTINPEKGAGTNIKPDEGGVYTNNYLFFMNIDVSDPENWVTQFPNKGSGGAKNLTIDALNMSSGYNGFWFGGSYHFENIRATGVGTLVGKPGLYTDAVVVKYIHANNRNNNTDYLLDLPGLGDAYEIVDIASGYLENQAGITNGLRLGQCRSGKVTGLINGKHIFQGTSAVTIEACHLEGGNIEINNAEVIISGNVFFTEEDNTATSIIVNNDDINLNKWLSVIENNEFVRMPNRRGGWGAVEKADIAFLNSSSIAILRNNTRTPSVSGQINVKATTGILIDLLGSGGGGLNNVFNKFSAFLSTESIKVSGGRVHVNKSFDKFAFTFTGLDGVILQEYAGTPFRETLQTYYYHCVILVDKDRLIGRTVTGSEVSVTPIDDTLLPTLQIGKGSAHDFSGLPMRVYRGTSSGLYDKYVDIPSISVGKLLDDGVALSGFPWNARTASGLDALNNNGLSGKFTVAGDNITIDTLAGRPDLGAWKQGDRVLRSSISVGVVGDPVITEYRRITTGVNNVNRVDWLALAQVEQ